MMKQCRVKAERPRARGKTQQVVHFNRGRKEVEEDEGQYAALRKRSWYFLWGALTELSRRQERIPSRNELLNLPDLLPRQ